MRNGRGGNIDAPRWRQAKEGDVSRIAAIGNRIHGGLQEKVEVFAEKLALFPQGCFVLEQERALAGYGLSHAWLLGHIPPLDTFLGTLPMAPDCLYIHDVVVLPQARGYRSVGTLIERLTDVAKANRLPRMALVSVHGTSAFWARQGFVPLAGQAMSGKLHTYGHGAIYMVGELDHALPRGD